MPFYMIRGDITKLQVDAIVNAANNSLLGGGGVDGAIHRAAGPKLLEECRTLGGCETGQAKLTGGYNLPAKYVIHTVGPIWRGGNRGERELLVSCYRNSLELASKEGCKTLAFPLISAGVYGYPKDQAVQVAVETIQSFLLTHDVSVTLVLFDRDAATVSKSLFTDISSYIDAQFIKEHADQGPECVRREVAFYRDAVKGMPMSAGVPGSQKEALSHIDESFSQMLLRKMDAAGLTDAQYYKKANIDRKLFSKIRNDPHYRPSKPTALAFAIALELDINETQELLRKAGFTLSHSQKLDIIVEYFILHGNYDIFQINQALFAFDQSLLGG
mgnify:FL=1